ncbi:MAG TPA: 3-deoxy-7-phosphoheptulonate synthase class II [Spirochaetota bacterium]|nr:3-deoxy-7-phosphoheptulonate synthase class II [Spirochaetota bacterium]
MENIKKKKIIQQPLYRDQEALSSVLREISLLPPLVFPGEISKLRYQLCDAEKGERFILQGGDCAERFIDCRERAILNKLKILLQMSVVLTYGAKKPVIKLGRIAGQYSKPRSNDFENIDGKEIPVYRGDSINGYEADLLKRDPDPARLMEAFYRSAVTLNYLRSAISGGFADLHHPDNWQLDIFRESSSWAKYSGIIERIKDSLEFMESIGGVMKDSVGSTDFYISHEGLQLDYETAVSRINVETGNYYNSSAHMLWIGERTRFLDSAHVDYFSKIENPVGIKFSSKADVDELIEIIKILNPENEKGKIILIHRFGISEISKLENYIRKIHNKKLNLSWCSDPMHGNIKNAGGIKTRDFSDILSELKSAFEIHSKSKSILSGVHFELTGDEVTECVGGASEIGHADLPQNYETYCDPRLNYSQSMEMAFLISQMLSSKK